MTPLSCDLIFIYLLKFLTIVKNFNVEVKSAENLNIKIGWFNLNDTDRFTDYVRISSKRQPYSNVTD